LPTVQGFGISIYQLNTYMGQSVSGDANADAHTVPFCAHRRSCREKLSRTHMIISAVIGVAWCSRYPDPRFAHQAPGSANAVTAIIV